jgi:hypothetical protein
MAARASGVHCPPLKNLPVSSVEIVFHTGGHEAPPALAKSGMIEDTSGSSGKEKAAAEEAKRIEAPRRIVGLGWYVGEWRSGLA